MEIARIIYEPRVVLEFTQAEVDILKSLCENHYDATVRSLVPPGREATVNGLLNSIQDGVAESGPLNNSRVQLLAKACEMAGYAGPGDRELGRELWWELSQVVKRLDSSWRAINAEQDWNPLPIVERINNLPEWLRRYVHDIEARCDPAGDVRTITELRDTIRALEARISELTGAR